MTDKASVIHETPLMYSDDRMHELNDEGECWCDPGIADVNGEKWVSHR